MTKFEYEHRRFDGAEPTDLVEKLKKKGWTEAVNKTVKDHYFTTDSAQVAVYVRDGNIKAKGVEKAIDNFVDKVVDDRAWQGGVSQKFLEDHLGIALPGNPDVKDFDAMKNALVANGAKYTEVDKEIWQYTKCDKEVEVTEVTIDGNKQWTVCVAAHTEDGVRKTVKKYGIDKLGLKAEYADVLKALNLTKTLAGK